VLWDYLGGKRDYITDGAVRSFILAGLESTVSRHHEGGTDVARLDVKTMRQEGLSEVKDAVALVRQRKDEREIGLLRCANQVSRSWLYLAREPI